MTLEVQGTRIFAEKPNETELRSRLDKLRRIEVVTHKWLQDSPTGLGSAVAMRTIANILAEDA